MKNLFLILILIPLIGGCDTEKIAPDKGRVGYDFFPLKVGSYNIYQVENIDYEVTGEVITSSFALKAEVVDSFVNQSGSLSYIIHYFKRLSEAEPWEFLRAWTARKNRNQAILVEENIPFLKISFPIAAGKVWDGNALNTEIQDAYQMDSLFRPFTTPAGDTIPDTITIVQEDNQNFITELDKRYEIYARHIGLIYKEDIRLNYCTDPNCLGQQLVESGHEYRMYLLKAGE